MKFLAEREKRIQENLKKYEEDILLKLMEAEKELIVRKDCIDEELAERQRHLSKMAIEWNAKHQEIIQLSKNFYVRVILFFYCYLHQYFSDLIKNALLTFPCFLDASFSLNCYSIVIPSLLESLRRTFDFY